MQTITLWLLFLVFTLSATVFFLLLVYLDLISDNKNSRELALCCGAFGWVTGRPPVTRNQTFPGCRCWPRCGFGSPCRTSSPQTRPGRRRGRPTCVQRSAGAGYGARRRRLAGCEQNCSRARFRWSDCCCCPAPAPSSHPLTVTACSECYRARQSAHSSRCAGRRRRPSCPPPTPPSTSTQICRQTTPSQHSRSRVYSPFTAENRKYIFRFNLLLRHQDNGLDTSLW